MSSLRPLPLLAALLCSLAGAQTLASTPLELGLVGGFAAGGSAQVFVGAPRLLGPLGARLSVERSRSAEGFDDDAPLDPSGPPGTVGEIKQSGLVTAETFSSLSYGLDVTYDLGQPVPGVATSVYGGGRYGQFSSRLEQGSEFTEYASSAYGLGLGTRADYLLTPMFSLVADLGLDFYFVGGPISRRGDHDAATFKPGEDAYHTVSRAVRRPGHVLRAMLGVKYSF